MAIASLVSVGILRPVLSYVFCYPMGLGVVGAWIGILIDQYARFLFSATRFYSQKWAR